MIVVWSEERSRYEAVTSYFERNEPKAARWRWDAARRRWWTGSEDIARRLAQYAQGAAALRLSTLSEPERQALALSTAADADIDVPCLPGLAYLPYQRAGIAYALMDRGGAGTLIADEMGLGKTIQAIGVVNALCAPGGDNRAVVGNDPARGISRVLIIVPASLRLNWRAEWLRWHTGPLKPHLLDFWPTVPKAADLFREHADIHHNRAVIVSYDSVRKWHPQIADVEWDMLICDEAHMLREEGTRRAKSIFGGKYEGHEFRPIRARRKLFLTGTALVNRAEDLWPLVRELAPSGLGASRADFMQRYKGGERLDDLHLRLRSQIMVRRKKEDVLKDLPAKRRQIILLDVPDSDAILAAEANVLDVQRAMLERTKREIAGLPHAEQVMRLRQCRGLALSEISRVRHETALRKLPHAIEHISDALGNLPKASCFYHHQDVGDALAREFGRISVQLDGRTPEIERQHAVTRFQSDPRARLFLGSTRAAGLGITLTAGSFCVFVELDWTPAMMMQAEDRHHRIGQKNPVLVQHLVIDGSIDCKMAKILVEKQAIMDAALDGKQPEFASRDLLNEVLYA